jgi:diaminopimelate decarboxylase
MTSQQEFEQRARIVAERFGTPTWVYDAATIRQRIAELGAFDLIRYAQKANSNLAILALMKQAGVVVDAVTAGEIFRALEVGFDPAKDEVVYTADIFDDDALTLIKRHQIPVNVGSPDMITQLGEAGINVPVTLRINPGFGHGHSQKVNTGGDHSKHGIWHTQIEECKRRAAEQGLTIRGLHMHIGSGADFTHLSKVCDAMVAAAEAFGDKLEIISAGGGLPVPYHKDNPERIDTQHYFELWNDARERVAKIAGPGVRLEVEPGRYLVAEGGALVTKIRSEKVTGDNHFLLIDAGFNDLMRPAFYGAYHHISIVPNEKRDPSASATQDYIVAGPLCESCDVFTQTDGGFVEARKLPPAQVDDLLILHDAGAYGFAMSSNYNSRRLAAEVLWLEDGPHLIRRRQPFEHLTQLEQIPDHLAMEAAR